jgi:hypothetical protein
MFAAMDQSIKKIDIQQTSTASTYMAGQYVLLLLINERLPTIPHAPQPPKAQPLDSSDPTYTMYQEACTCFLCDNIRKSLPNIDPEFTRTSANRWILPQGLDHNALVARHKEILEHDLVVAESKLKKSVLEVTQLELDAKMARLRGETCERELKREG